METTGSAHGLSVLLIALIVALLLLQISRGLRRIVQWLITLIVRVVPKPVARLMSVVVVSVLLLFLVNGVLWTGALHLVNNAYSAANATIDPTLQRPTQAERSGSPASNETWESLGAAGREFVAGGPTLDQLRAFAAAGSAVDPATVEVPVRVYAGLNPDGDLDATAANVVAELDRTHAWDRSILVVATTTGTGWIDPGISYSLELMHGGDSAIAAMQYSYLPSWISFIGDRSTPPAAGKALFEAVYSRWSELPENSRPRLIAYGISLGSFGAQGAFSGVQDIAARADGALFVGTPSFTPLAAELTDERDPGSLERQPVLDDGRQVRWGEQVTNGIDLWQLGNNWAPPRGDLRSARLRRRRVVVPVAAVVTTGLARRAARAGRVGCRAVVPGRHLLAADGRPVRRRRRGHPPRPRPQLPPRVRRRTGGALGTRWMDRRRHRPAQDDGERHAHTQHLNRLAAALNDLR